MTASKFNDVIINEGFPEGWFIQDRLDDDVALLIQTTPGMWPGTSCICLRPKALRTVEWVPTAREIAHAVVDRRRSQMLLAESRTTRPNINCGGAE